MTQSLPLTARQCPPKMPSAEGTGGLKAFFSTKFLRGGREGGKEGGKG